MFRIVLFSWAIYLGGKDQLNCLSPGALYILYPGLFVLGGVLFLLTLFVLRRDQRRAELTQGYVNSELSEQTTAWDVSPHCRVFEFLTYNVAQPDWKQTTFALNAKLWP